MIRHVHCPHCRGKLTVSVKVPAAAVVVEAYTRPLPVQAALAERIVRILGRAGRHGLTEREIYRGIHAGYKETFEELQRMATEVPPLIVDEPRGRRTFFVLPHFVAASPAVPFFDDEAE